MKRIASIALIAATAAFLATSANAADPRFLDFNVSLFSPTHISSAAVYSGHHGSAAVAYSSGYYSTGHYSTGPTQYWGVPSYPAPICPPPAPAPVFYPPAPAPVFYPPAPAYHNSHHGWGHYGPAIGFFGQVGLPGHHPITSIGVGIF